MVKGEFKDLRNFVAPNRLPFDDGPSSRKLGRRADNQRFGAAALFARAGDLSEMDCFAALAMTGRIDSENFSTVYETI
jgi:hypothetical protein